MPFTQSCKVLDVVWCTSVPFMQSALMNALAG